MASRTATTTAHDEIRRWVEEHDGKPASVRGTGGGDDSGVLRIDFPGGAGEDERSVSGTSSWFGAVQPWLWRRADSTAMLVALPTLCGDPQPRMSRIRREDFSTGS